MTRIMALHAAAAAGGRVNAVATVDSQAISALEQHANHTMSIRLQGDYCTSILILVAQYSSIGN